MSLEHQREQHEDPGYKKDRRGAIIAVALVVTFSCWLFSHDTVLSLGMGGFIVAGGKPSYPD